MTYVDPADMRAWKADRAALVAEADLDLQDGGPWTLRKDRMRVVRQFSKRVKAITRALELMGHRIEVDECREEYVFVSLAG